MTVKKSIKPKAQSSSLKPAKSKLPKKLSYELGLEFLKLQYPDAHCALNYENPFQLLIATILSAQCTDERVNIVTKDLFAQYPDALSLSKASLPQIEKIIRSAGFYKNKAKSLKNCSTELVRLGFVLNEVPRELDELVKLAGVGRKTANVVLGNAYGITSGIVVDTHVGRLSNRWGWTKTENAVQIEKDLEKVIPHEDWIMLSHWMIFHGRQVCKARNPQCENCGIKNLCPRLGVKQV